MLGNPREISSHCSHFIHNLLYVCKLRSLSRYRSLKIFLHLEKCSSVKSSCVSSWGPKFPALTSSSSKLSVTYMYREAEVSFGLCSHRPHRHTQLYTQKHTYTYKQRTFGSNMERRKLCKHPQEGKGSISMSGKGAVTLSSHHSPHRTSTLLTSCFQNSEKIHFCCSIFHTFRTRSDNTGQLGAWWAKSHS